MFLDLVSWDDEFAELVIERKGKEEEVTGIRVRPD